ncbi:MAG: penicillin-binding transpeptidase domain-containing protein [Pseudomonadota bacterium]
MPCASKLAFTTRRVIPKLVTSLALLACGPRVEPAPRTAAAPSPPQSAPPDPVSEPEAPAVVEDGALSAHLERERVTGVIALLDGADGRVRCSDRERCARGYLPASTFKIPNTVIALETAVVDDSESALPWDGKPYLVEDWNRDHTLRSAIRVSCVPCYQRIAREIGSERMKDWLARLEYGNQDTSGGIDRFWLEGGLRISPLEQIEFLRRLESGTLPIGARTREIVLDILALDVTDSYVLRGKTGLSRPPEVPSDLGWFVGWVENGSRRVFVATLIDSHPPDVDIVPVRRRVSEHALRATGVLP